ncbi:hypothetical protein FKX85_05585 [Echinicola soli]|uniref:Lipoprotein n=1 Tax=Echinicola soli TaxID=2591634 RepID=A0A514CFC7_9BACT|nr:hypothetical protein [Echinicola soli]QDH78529.1 hypothetical protein FKX85_05585 [Echinicola soli]
MCRMLGMYVIIFLLCACQPASPQYPDSKCAEATEFVQEVENRKGRLYRMEDSESYAISYHYPETVDMVDVGVVCHIPADFPLPETAEEALEVTFSGKYWKYTDVPPAMAAGSTVYYLEVATISQE